MLSKLLWESRPQTNTNFPLFIRNSLDMVYEVDFHPSFHVYMKENKGGRKRGTEEQQEQTTACRAQCQEYLEVNMTWLQCLCCSMHFPCMASILVPVGLLACEHQYHTIPVPRSLFQFISFSSRWLASVKNQEQTMTSQLFPRVVKRRTAQGQMLFYAILKKTHYCL